MDSFLSAIGIKKKGSSRSRSPSPNPSSRSNDDHASQHVSSASASSGAGPRKSVPSQPDVTIEKVFYVNRTANPFVADNGTRTQAIKVSLPQSVGSRDGSGTILVTSADGTVILDRQLEKDGWGFRSNASGHILFRIRNEENVENAVAELASASSLSEPLPMPRCDNGDMAPSASMQPSASMIMLAPSHDRGALAPDHGAAPMGKRAAGYVEVSRDMAPPRRSTYSTLENYTEHCVFMDPADMTKLKAFLDPHSRDERDPIFHETSPRLHPDVDMMIMTIGQYVDPLLTNSAGTSWLLKGDDLSGASFRDIADIYRSLGASADRTKSLGFKEFASRTFVTPLVRAELMSRLDAAFVAAGSVNTDTKLDLSLHEFEALVGSNALTEIQSTFGVPIDKIKMRRVCALESTSGRPAEVINFHLDKFAKTMGIPLNEDSEYDGSRLTFALPGSGKLVQPARRAGTATVHDNRIAHGVTPITRGVRYGLFLLSHSDATIAN